MAMACLLPSSLVGCMFVLDLLGSIAACDAAAYLVEQVLLPYGNIDVCDAAAANP